MSKKIMESVEDDLQLKVDTFFEKVTQYFMKEARFLKEESVRQVCVEYPHIEAGKIKKLFKKCLENSVEEEAFNHYKTKWFKSLES